MHFHKYRILIVSTLFYSQLIAQNSPPGTDIYLVPLEISNGKISLGVPQNLTDRSGYDNQPAFNSDGRSFLYTSYRDNDQADVRSYYIETKKSRSVTDTPESEYSPTPIHGDSHFSTVRVEMDGTQRLWQFNKDGSDPQLILDDIVNVGYHGWGNDSTVGLFIVGTPNTFILANPFTGISKMISENSGRSIHKVPNEDALSFVHKTSDDEWWIKKVHLQTQDTAPIISTLPGSEDYVWTSEGVLLMARSSSLYKFDPGTDTDWVLIRSYSESGLQSIKRIAVNPNDTYLLMVSDRNGQHTQ